MNEPRVIVSGSFDDLRFDQVRFLAEAARRGPIHALLWSDEVVKRLEGKPPKFPESERLYLLDAIRYVDCVTLCIDGVERDSLNDRFVSESRPKVWAVAEAEANDAKREFCRKAGIDLQVIRPQDMAGYPDVLDDLPEPSANKRVLVTGCFDWFHSGHVRFFEEVSELGDLYVVVGHDANIKLLKGEGHPLFPEQQRRFLIQAVRHVKRAFISTGHGWLDAEPEIRRIKPHIYAVNEDGDRPEKRQYCQLQGIEYRVLKRLPKEGLPRRQSTDLRGF